MKITKQRLKQIIKEEVNAQKIKQAKELLSKGLIDQEEYERILNPQKKKDDQSSLSGPTTADQPNLSGPTTAGPLSGQTRVDQPQDVKKKAVALDQVEALLAKLLKQIQQL